jgi:hypothetical protein
VLLAPVIGAIVLVGCGIRKPPTPCAWPHLSASQSFLDDIKRAEDISIRHSDAKPYGATRRAARESCEAELFTAIATSRSLTIDDVHDARRQLDQRGFDWVVNAPMAAFTCATAWLMVRRTRRRFPEDRRARVVAIALLSVGLGGLVIGVEQVWAFAVEGIRVGNDHLGYRGLRIPWARHRAATFALTLLAMWVMAAWPSRRARHQAQLAPGTHL